MINSEDNFEYYIDGETNIIKLNELDELLEGIYACNGTNEFGSAIYKYQIYLAGNFFYF